MKIKNRVIFQIMGKKVSAYSCKEKMENIGKLKFSTHFLVVAAKCDKNTNFQENCMK